MRATKPFALSMTVLLSVSLVACSNSADDSESEAGSGDDAVAAQEETAAGGESTTDESSSDESSSDGEWEPVTIEHALGTTEIEEEPERVATVAWGNHEVPLALGIVPVGMASTTFGDDNGDGLMPWVEERLEELDAETPVLFDETDGIDFEAVADTNPDVILAAYSGLSQSDYDTLSEIAPTVAYPENPWGTTWREDITMNSAGLGMQEEGEQLIEDLEGEIEETVAEYPAVEGTAAAFLTHVDPGDLSEISFYTTHDRRPKFLEDVGMVSPESIVEASEGTEEFSMSQSAEQADTFSDIEVIITYGGEELTTALNDDPILSQMPAVENEAIVALPGDQPVGNSANPTTLSIPYMLDEYLSLVSEAVNNE